MIGKLLCSIGLHRVNRRMRISPSGTLKQFYPCVRCRKLVERTD